MMEKMKMRAAFLFTMLLCVASIATAQAPAPAQPGDQPTAPYTIQAGARIVLVPATVEVKGKILYGLKPEQFVVEDNGVPQKITMDEDTDSLGLSLVVLLQCSRTAVMEYAQIEKLPEMIDALVGGAPREIALVRYGSHPELVQPFTHNMDQVASSMARMGPCEDDKAATIDAVSYGASILANRRDRYRRAILLISETRDHGSTVKESHVIEQLGKTNTVVDAVSFSPIATDSYRSITKFQPGGYGVLGLLFSAVQALRQNAPKTLAHLSGGEYINFVTKKGFENGLLDLTNHVHNYYLLSFPIPQDAPDGLHALTVRIPEYPKATIRARENYWAGEKPAPDVP
jgi:VWFA-related protein